MRVFGAIVGLVGLVFLFCIAEARTKVIFETEPKEELTRGEMYAQLNSVSPDHVAKVLSQVEDKKSVRVTGGLSVDQLLAQNEVSTSQCKKRSLRMRVAVCERTKNFTTINLYCRLCLVEAVKFCLDQLDSMLVDGLVDEVDRKLLLSLSSHIPKTQEDLSGFGGIRTTLEQLVASSNDLERAGTI